MCGISGTLRQSSDGPAIVQDLLRSQRRRGPDHSEWHQSQAGRLHLTFGHNRLAIVDLDPRSNQPFVDKTNQQLLVYNGEIYNYLELKQELTQLGATFSTSSDTEVLLKAYQFWGLDAFAKFNGMFAFALYDPALKRTLLVRDRFGVKPLYYHIAEGRLTFASSPSALAREVETSIYFPYLEEGTRSGLYDGLSNQSAFTGVLALGPGECLIFENETATIERFYDLPQRVDLLAKRLAQQSPGENQKELEQLLLSAVELRLRADVPTTLSLSGGLDSGLCAALIKEVRSGPFEAFTFADSSLPGSEAGLAELTAKHLQIKLHYVVPVAAQATQLFDSTLAAQGAPFGHISGLAQNAIFAAIHGANYKVSMGGQGADEGFAGYRKFQLSVLKENYHRHEFLSLAQESIATGWTFTRELGSPQNYLYNFLRLHRTHEPFLRGAHSASLRPDTGKTLRERQIADVRALSLPTLLRYEDSNSMYHSIESRMPFLDYRVMEFGLALPKEQKIKDGFGKYILRQIAEPRLPEEIVWDRNKRAFSLAPKWWLNTGLGSALGERVQKYLPELRPHLSDSALVQVQNPKFYLQAKNFAKMTTLIWLIQQVGAKS